MRYFRINRKGFSYIEVMIATTLLAIALVPIVHSLSAPWLASSEEDYLILNSSRDKMEEVLAMDFSATPLGTTLSDSVTIGGKTIDRDVTVALYDIDGNPGLETDAKMITVDVEHILINALKVDP